MPFPPVEEQLAVIRRGIEQIVPEEELAEKLRKSRDTNTPLRIKYGIDPTGIDVHLGHTVPLRKMRQFQDLGHQAVLIIGNYTALVGDPSGRDEARTRLTEEQIDANARDYIAQVKKIVDLDGWLLIKEPDDLRSSTPSRISGNETSKDVRRDLILKIKSHGKKTVNGHAAPVVIHNGAWFSEMAFSEVLTLFGKVTVRQLLSRDDFAKRFKDEKNPSATIYMHEMFYPVMQAWDSVWLDADVELGGTEQLFSFMMARHLQSSEHQTPQIGVMSPILVGLDGKRRMGKSLGNYIGVNEPPYEMMKKFMQVPDEVMRMYFELLTSIPIDEVDTLLSGHPKEAKTKLARTIITEYHDTESAEEAVARWQNEIGGSALPADIPVVQISRGDLDADASLAASRLFVATGLSSSNSEARRLIAQGGGKLGEDKTKIESFDQQITVENGLLLWAGKKKFCRLELTD